MGDITTEAYAGTRAGVVDGSILTAIVDAIRAQNGSTTRYKPGEMAWAIRDLV